ncbi:hypothetical protein C1646_821832 [Rhizophagus diaphanus]|nr:hypothetical protein C1646_821832 [Rhizophagus diaphanus] [Rhizophagus sp. MUCL 43196]
MSHENTDPMFNRMNISVVAVHLQESDSELTKLISIELNAKILAKITELRKKFAEIKVENNDLKDKNTEIPELRRKFAKIEAERAELKARIAELLKQGVEENKRRDAENAELKARIEELEKNKADTTKLVSENAEFRDRITKGNNSSNNSLSNFNSVADQANSHHEKSLVDKEMDTSLLEELIPEVIAKQSVSAVNISIMDHCNQTSLEDKETDAFLNEVHKKKINDEIRQRNRKKKLQAQESLPISPEEKRTHFLDSITQLCNSTSSEVSANSDGGKVPSEEKICNSSIEQNQSKGAKHVTEISKTLYPRKVTSNKSSIDEASQHLAQLCDKAFDAEDKANRANQKEILCWCLYAKDFIIQLNGIIESSGDSLRKKTQRAEKVYKFIERVGLDKIKYIKSYSATFISELTNEQIQEVIDYGIFSEKLPLVIDRMTEISEILYPRKNLPKNTPPKTKNDQISAPIPSTYNSNSSSNSSGTEPARMISPATPQASVSPVSIPRTNPTYDRSYFRNKILDQYSNLYREFSSENFDYYGITDETSYLLCKLDYNDEEGIDGRYEARSYFIKCEQHEIEIVA